MNTYVDRDLIRTFFFTFIGLFIFIQVGVFVSVLLENYRYVFSSGDSKLGWLLLYYAVTIPRQLVNTTPVAAAVTVLWVYTQKARTNEILAYMVGGVSPMRLARPLLVVSGLLAIGTYALTESIAGKSDAVAERVKKQYIEDKSLESITREKNVFQKAEGMRFYDIRAFHPLDSKMEAPVIYENDPVTMQPKWRLEALSAEQVDGANGPEWIFKNAVFRQFDEKGNVTSYKTMAQASESELLPQRLEKELTGYLQQRRRPAQMSFMELRDYIQLYERQGKPTYELQAYMHFNIAMAMGCFVLACLMVGHILKPSSASVLVGFGGGLMLIGAYYVMLIFARTASMKGAFPAVIGAYGVNVAFLCLALFLLSRDRTA
ncbi:hypothetical protein BH09SUM1_BH09SUM1_13100 [soil metagenome]